MTKPSKPYKMIVFDAGGTLISADWPQVTRDLAAEATRYGLTLSGSAVFHGMREVWRQVILGRIRDQADSPEAVAKFWRQLFAEAISRAAGISGPLTNESHNGHALKIAASFYPTFDAGDYHCLLDQAPETLEALLAAGYRLGLLSNWSPSLADLLERLGIHHFFEFVIVSSVVRLAKPDRAIFDLAVEQSGCRPDQLLYVGDSPAADIKGSLAAGWDAVLITHQRHDRYAQVEVPQKVDTLAELQTLLGAA